jgi:hypothetical protein
LKEPPHRKKLQKKQTKLRKEQESRAVRKIKEAAPNLLTLKTSRFPLTQLTNNACKLQNNSNQKRPSASSAAKTILYSFVCKMTALSELFWGNFSKKCKKAGQGERALREI